MMKRPFDKLIPSQLQEVMAQCFWQQVLDLNQFLEKTQIWNGLRVTYVFRLDIHTHSFPEALQKFYHGEFR